MSKKDYYETLNIPKIATEEEIKKAYKKMALKYHPDRNKEKGAEEIFKQVNEAYSILSDPEKRKVYDKFGFAGLENNGMNFNGNMGDIFGSFFNDMFGGGGAEDFGPFSSFSGFNNFKQSKPRKIPVNGDKIIENVTIGFNDSVNGCTKKINVDVKVKCSVCNGLGGKNFKTCDNCKGSGKIRKTSQQGFMMMMREEQCPTCKGKGEKYEEKCKKCNGYGLNFVNKVVSLKIQKGIKSGDFIRLKKEGHCGLYGGENGDIVFIIRVKNHKLFLRKDDNVYLNLPLMFNEAILGCKKTIPTIYGNYELDIPPYTQNDKEITIKDHGFYNQTEQTKGDMFIHISVVIPKEMKEGDLKKIKQIDNYETPETKQIKNFIN